MSQGPSIRDLKAIVESYNAEVAEEYEIGGMKEVMAMFSKDDILGFMRDYDLIGNDAVMDDETYAHFADQYAMRDVDDMDGEDWYGFLVDFLRDNKLDGTVEEDFDAEKYFAGKQPEDVIDPELSPSSSIESWSQASTKSILEHLNEYRFKIENSKENPQFYSRFSKNELGKIEAEIKIMEYELRQRGVDPALADAIFDSVEESDKPYATMKDGPDKYLFRKDQKQKLVGSADNEPEDGEEELEESLKTCPDCNGEGVIDGADPTDPGDDEWCNTCNGKGEVYSSSDDNYAVNEEETMDKFIREMQIAAGIIVEDGKPWEDDEVVEEEAVDEDESCDEEVIEEDCDESEDDKNDDGDCSPFTHADENVEMVREEELDEDDFIEDLLLAPKGDVGPGPDEVDEQDPWSGHDTADYANSVGDIDDRIEPELDRQTDFDAPSRYDGDDSDDMFDDANTHVGREFASSEFGGEGGNTHVGREFASGEMTEEPNDDERIIDVGDDEDYETYDFDNEFENMLGGSSDMPEAELQGGMYEMNDLRRLAGLEQLVEEEECDEEEACDDDKEELDEIAPVIAAVARGAGAALAKGAMGGDDVEEATAGSPVVGDLIAYEVDDETAYYVMADVIGNELDFGPEDEILVPAARNDQVLVALDQQGFVKGKDFWVAGEQFEAELQNGYNDRDFSDGQDYFPKGATSQPASDLGPTAGDQGDNPMANKMRSVKRDDVYETMKLAYRRHRKS